MTHAPSASRTPPPQAFEERRPGLDLRLVDDRRDAAERGGDAARLERVVVDVDGTVGAHVDVAVHRAREHVEPVGVDLAPAAQAGADGRDPLAVDGHVRPHLAFRADQPAAADHEVVSRSSRHGDPAPVGRQGPLAGERDVERLGGGVDVAGHPRGIARAGGLEEPLHPAPDRRHREPERDLRAVARAAGGEAGSSSTCTLERAETTSSV